MPQQISAPTNRAARRHPVAAAYLTTADAAHYLAVGESTLRKWQRAGLITPVRVGPKLLRWRIADLDAMASA